MSKWLVLLYIVLATNAVGVVALVGADAYRQIMSHRRPADADTESDTYVPDGGEDVFPEPSPAAMWTMEYDGQSVRVTSYNDDGLAVATSKPYPAESCDHAVSWLDENGWQLDGEITKQDDIEWAVVTPKRVVVQIAGDSVMTDDEAIEMFVKAGVAATGIISKERDIAGTTYVVEVSSPFTRKTVKSTEA